MGDIRESEITDILSKKDIFRKYVKIDNESVRGAFDVNYQKAKGLKIKLKTIKDIFLMNSNKDFKKYNEGDQRKDEMGLSNAKKK